MEENLIAGAAIVGIVNAVTMQFPQVKGLLALLLAIGLGVVLGAVHYFGVGSIEQGILIALASSGVYKVATKAGGK